MPTPAQNRVRKKYHIGKTRLLKEMATIKGSLGLITWRSGHEQLTYEDVAKGHRLLTELQEYTVILEAYRQAEKKTP